MDEILLTRTLRSQGYQHEELARMLRDGSLRRIRRGAYERMDTDDERSIDVKRRRLVLATLPQLSATAVVSHGSAALLLALPTWPEATARVHVTRNRRTGARR